MRIHLHIRRHRTSGAAMLMALMFVIVCTIALTAWVNLLAARVRQVDAMTDSTQRHIAWSNMKGIQQQYAFTWAFRDKLAGADGTGSTRDSTAATPVAKWGGITASAFSSLTAFRSVNRSADGVMAYPFNNLFPLPTPDKDVYFEGISGDSDATQSQAISINAYLKSYPPSLMGDLLVLHKKPSGVTNHYLSDNIRVNGRVVVWDGAWETENIRAETCLNMTKSGTNSIKNMAYTSVVLPQNLPTTARTTNGGYGAGLTGVSGTGVSAVTNGTLNLVSNANFAPGSIRNIIRETGYDKWVRIGTLSNVPASTSPAPYGTSQYITTGSDSGSGTSPIQVKLYNTGSPGSYPYPLAPSPISGQTAINGSPGSRLHTVFLRLTNSSLQHVVIEGGVEMLIIEGSTTTTGYSTANGQSPIIISVEQTNMPDIRFVGENNRRFILATKGSASSIIGAPTRVTTGDNLYCCWMSGNSSGSGTVPSSSGTAGLDWRMHWINEDKRVHINITNTSLQLILTGGMRTDSDMNYLGAGANERIIFERETSPGGPSDPAVRTLEELLPRDGWVEPYFLAQ